MFPSYLPPIVVDRLYRTAEKLQIAWSQDELALDFDSRMIDAVLRHLEKFPAPPMSEAELARYADRLLRQFWRQNARRDYARIQRRREKGLLPEVISLDILVEEGKEPWVDLYHGMEDDHCGGELGRAIAQALVDDGMAPRWAWVFVWRATGSEWEDIVVLVRERFGVRVTSVQLRSWARRHWQEIRDRIRRAFPGGAEDADQ